MKKKRCFNKIAAATLLIVLATNTFAPATAYALTAGPTAPEATSFEPVDTTDMVNLNTGAFTYNLPLLEVPGPEGGYPLSLSYHAGIKPDLDASWVGLGWTLNPGAINRNVNGAPDDWNGVEGTVRDYWSGGEQWKATLGVSLGYSVVSVRAGLTFGNDTYKGFGIGGYVGVGVTLNDLMGIGITVGVSPWGDPYGSLGLSLGGKIGNSGLTGSIGVGLSTNFETVGGYVSGGVGWSHSNPNADPKNNAVHKDMNGSILGASISTNDGKASFSIGGVDANISSSSAGKISTSNTGLVLDIPVWYGVNITLGYEKTRYWSDETVTTKSYGSYINKNPVGAKLHATGGDSSVSKEEYYDTYSLLEGDGKNIIDNPDSRKLQGGSFPEYDQYIVTAQGVSGVVRPYTFQSKIYHQSYLSPNNTNEYIGYNYTSVPQNVTPEFRFENDFSNAYRQSYVPSAVAGGYSPSNFTGSYYATPSFDPDPEYGNNDGNFGYGGGNKLAGSKSVKVGVVITPSKVDTPGVRKAINYRPNAIPGFSITNASGVTYHYALPVYAFEEEVYQGRKDDKSNSFNRLIKPKAYAFTWYLTTITGPDFVDRNNNHIADAGDWGYYVNFEYGLWNENFMWRNPAEGFNQDEDPLFEGISMGQKEIYYLNAIKTRTHTALFEKEERIDGKGASALIKTIRRKDPAQRYYLYENGRFDNTSQPVMRLNKMYLLNNEDAGIVNYGQSGSGSYSTQTITIQDPTPLYPISGLLERSITIPDHKARKENVLDKADIDPIRQQLEAKAVRIIDFNYDYSLCKGTLNSFLTTAPETKYGKLTLKDIKIRGKGGSDLLPVTKFNYNLDDDDVKRSSYAYTIGTTPAAAHYRSTFSGESKFEIGDLIETDETNAKFLGVIIGKNGSVYTLMNNPNGATVTSKIRTTKNPPYDRLLKDVWQMYKSNARTDKVEKNANRYRGVDDVSAKATDVWSLRSLSGPFGEKVKIEYESNTYDNVLLNDSYPHIANSLIALERQDNYIKRAKLKIEYADMGYSSINDIVDVGGVGRIVMLLDFNNSSGEHRFVPVYAELTVDAINNDNTLNVSFNNHTVGDVATLKNKNTLFGKILKGLLSGGVSVIQDLTLSGYSYKECLTANVSFFKKQKPYEYGGGSRVKKVSVIADGQVNSTQYGYANIDGEGSSGVTTYTPTTLPVCDENVAAVNAYAGGIKEYKRLMYAGIGELYSYAREIPSPGVFYEYVTVTNQIRKIGEPLNREKDGKTLYQFEVPNSHTVKREVVFEKDWNTAPPVWRVKERHISLKNFTSPIGNLKKTITYDNNNKKLTETVNNFLHDGLESETDSMFFVRYKERLQRFAFQGYLHERNFEAKGIGNGGSGYTGYYRHVTYSSRETYPCIPLGTTVINYVNGTKTTTENLAFDFYSGAVTKTINVDANGNRVMNEVIPAYRQYPEMGLKSMDVSKKNMLTQTAASYSYRVDANNGKLGLVAASVNTWSKEVNVLMPNYESTMQDGTHSTGNVWRPKMTYTWAPGGSSQNGMTAIGVFADFNWTNQDNPSAQNAGWVKTSQVTLYDVFSHALEASDMNEEYAATKMGYDHSKVMASGGPAKYAEIAYSGAEDSPFNDMFNGDVKLGNATINTTAAYVHTGVKSVQLNNGTGFKYDVSTVRLDASRDYWASVWVKGSAGVASNAGIFYNNGSGQVNGTLSAPNPNGWQLATIHIPAAAVSGTTITVGCYNSNGVPVYFDDIRFHPFNAGINSYVYDNFSGELTYILDNNNFFTKFEYDGVGRLTKTYRETIPDGVRPVNEFLYHYGNP